MIDYTSQISLSRRLAKMKTELFEFLVEMAQETYDKKERPWGIFIVVGNYAPSYKLERYVQIGDNEFSGHVVTYGTKAFKDAIKKSRYSDGAFIIDSASGQLLGNRVLYLDLKPDIQEEKGARHHAAASVSKDEYIDFVIAVSEETLTTRIYVGGVIEASQEVSEPEPVEEESDDETDS